MQNPKLNPISQLSRVRGKRRERRRGEEVREEDAERKKREGD
jgi:hypothetical protein